MSARHTHTATLGAGFAVALLTASAPAWAEKVASGVHQGAQAAQPRPASGLRGLVSARLQRR
jgi:hypothetical protein